MSMMKRHTENEIERISKASGYDYCYLMDIYNEWMEDEGKVNMTLFEQISMERDW